MKDTGERELPSIPGTLENIDPKHLERYKWASSYTHNKKVYDIASGAGYGSLLLEASDYIGFDNSPEAVLYSNKYYTAKPNITFLEADACNMPSHFPKADVIVSFETIEHLIDPEAFLDWCRAYGKMLLISTPIRHSFGRSRFHLFEYRLVKFHEALNKRFSKVTMFVQKENMGISYPCLPEDKGVAVAVCEA